VRPERKPPRVAPLPTAPLPAGDRRATAA